MTDNEPTIDITSTDEYIKLKADYDTAISELNTLKDDYVKKDAEITKLQAYIAKYVTTRDNGEGSKGPAPLDFGDAYKSLINEMANNLKKVN